MRAVILAAGRGHRLREVTGDRPKCLVRIGDQTLLQRQIQSLRRCGVDEIAVVAGHRAAEVRRDRKSTRLNSSHPRLSRMPSSA